MDRNVDMDARGSHASSLPLSSFGGLLNVDVYRKICRHCMPLLALKTQVVQCFCRDGRGSFFFTGRGGAGKESKFVERGGEPPPPSGEGSHRAGRPSLIGTL